MRSLSLILLLAGGAGGLGTFAMALSGDMAGATRMAGIAASAVILGMILHRR